MSGHLRAPSAKEPLVSINPLNAELNPICHLLALLGVHHFLHVSRIRFKEDTGWVPEQMWKFWKRKSLACLGNRPTVAPSAIFFWGGGEVEKITLLTLCYICFLWINKRNL